jgi:homoserine dehydrogenase
MPTASAVVSDVIYACHAEGRHKYMTFVNSESISDEIELVNDFACVYCVRLHVADQPGTMAAIAGAFADNGVSLKSVIQLGETDGESSRITFLTHKAKELSVREALKKIQALDCVNEVESLIRVEE